VCQRERASERERERKREKERERERERARARERERPLAGALPFLQAGNSPTDSQHAKKETAALPQKKSLSK
jgi:hypothetical protein